MSMRTRVTGLALGVGVALSGALVAAGPAQALEPGYFSVPYADTLFFADDDQHFAATFEEWTADGNPAPSPVPTDFVKYPWAPSIYAVSYFDDSWEWSPLSLEQWQRAGSPAPRTAGFIEGTDYYRWSTSSTEIFAFTSEDNTSHQLTFAEWTDAGRPDARTFVDAGFGKLSWSGTIGYFEPVSAGVGVPITFDEWAFEDFPTPQVFARFPGDEFCQLPGDATVYYYGALESTELTLSEYRAAGSPRPTLC